MYFPSYNPTINDLYLYGPSNTGNPIGLNPNCLLYDARESYKSIGVRPRSFTVQIPSLIGPTAGTPLSQYANYYNMGYPLTWKLSETHVGGSCHYMGRKPSDSIGVNGSTIKQTGITANYGINFWNSDYSGFCYYVDFYGMYNCVSYIPEVEEPIYFEGSPEISGFGSGATFYRVLQDDHGLMDIIPGSNPSTLQSPYLEAISIFTTLKDQNININNFISTKTETYISYLIPVSNMYYIGGCDTVSPIQQIGLQITLTNILFSDITTSIDCDFYIENGGSFWTGDSSGLVVYKKNNKLYSISHGLSTASNIISGPMHANSLMPLLNYFVNQTDISSYYFKGLDTSSAAIMGNELNNMISQLSNLNTLITNKINELSN